MNKAKIGDIWVYNNSWHYLIIEQCNPPYEELYNAVRLQDDERTTINPDALHDRHMWKRAV